jgi:hypothetical protein
MPGVCAKTLLNAKKHYIFMKAGVHAYISSVEAYLFEMPTAKFNIGVLIVTLMFWSILSVRFVYSRNLEIHLYSKVVMLGFDIRSSEAVISYRGICLIQLAATVLLIGLLVLTNASLPAVAIRQ